MSQRIIEPLQDQPDYKHNDRLMLPLMPLRGVMVYPNNISHLDVGRDRSINAIEHSMESDSDLIFLVMQRDARVDEPEQDDLYEIGVVSRVRQFMKLPGGSVRLLTEGLYRARLLSCQQTNPYIMAEIMPLEEYSSASDIEMRAYARVLKSEFESYVKKSQRIPSEALNNLARAENNGQIVDLITELLPLSAEEHQEMLETLDVGKRMERGITLLNREASILSLEQSIADKVRRQMEKSQKEYYLREQIKAIQDELGEADERAAEIEQYREKAAKANLPEYVMEKFESELRRLEKTPPMAAEAMVINNYLDTILELPWNNVSEENKDIRLAERILNEDHFGLEKPKERILEYLAACQLKNSLRGPILCLVGPPGVGKTSLARSIARATGREFVRMSLGGVKDEAEIRGHRRTYVGAMPGRIIANIKQAGVSNPLFLLDEVDKLASDWHGDPTSALLEALDPEQNSTFADHYLDIPYDLSQIMFVTTANYRNQIPRPLQDRMEIIEISSYTDVEKLSIARRHLLPKQLREHGISKTQLAITPPAYRSIIRNYTREAGVRELERNIAKICRRACRDIVTGEQLPFQVTSDNLEYYLGVPRYIDDKLKKTAKLGVATGLAWTAVGGELLQIEIQTVPGKGKFIITGQLGDVMKESVQTAYTYLRSVGKKYKVPINVDEKVDLHLHVPEGAVPKDGPSAGVTIATALASQFSGRKVRGDIAMTGEITLHGLVLPVGGIKEKVLAAWRNGIKTIILPKGCAKDLEQIPPDIREKITFHLVEHTTEVFDLALT